MRSTYPSAARLTRTAPFRLGSQDTPLDVVTEHERVLGSRNPTYDRLPATLIRTAFSGARRTESRPWFGFVPLGYSVSRATKIWSFRR